MQAQLSQGHIDPLYETVFESMLARYTEIDAVVLACTELPLAINARNSPKPLIDPVQCQCEAAARFAFSNDLKASNLIRPFGLS